MKTESSLLAPEKASKILMAAAFAGMMLPRQSDAQVATEPPDYGNSFVGRTDLGSGIVLVQGSVDGATDPNDYFQISGLAPNSPFSIQVTGLYTGTQAPFAQFYVFNLSSGILAQAFGGVSPGSPTFNATLTGVVPADGTIVGAAQLGEGSGTLTYSFAVPEPRASILTAAAALAAIAARRRKKSSQPAE